MSKKKLTGVLMGLLFTFAVAGTVSGQEYKLTPYEQISTDIETLASFSQGRELMREIDAYVGRDPCLSMHREGDSLVFYWWCERFYMIREAYVMEISQ